MLLHVSSPGGLDGHWALEGDSSNEADAFPPSIAADGMMVTTMLPSCPDAAPREAALSQTSSCDMDAFRPAAVDAWIVSISLRRFLSLFGPSCYTSTYIIKLQQRRYPT